MIQLPHVQEPGAVEAGVAGSQWLEPSLLAFQELGLEPEHEHTGHGSGEMICPSIALLELAQSQFHI